jgi:hypothetical protein
MNNLQCVIAVLSRHREARKWADEAVATDVLAQLGLDASGEAEHAVIVIDPTLVTETEVVAAELAVKEATDKAKAARAALDAQIDARPQPDKPSKVVTQHFADGTSDSGGPLLPDQLPGQQAPFVPAFVPPVAHVEPVPVMPAPLLPASPVPPLA